MRREGCEVSGLLTLMLDSLMSDNRPVPDPSMPKRFSAVGLLVKLIVLPGLFVLVLVLIAMLVGWWTLSAGDVDSLVDDLDSKGNARWRAAVHLAGLLEAPGGKALKEDPALAGRLSAILAREIDAAGVHREQIMLRMYLCRALGEFHLADPLPVLIEAARTERDPREVDVRRSAVEALAALAENVGPSRLRACPELLPALIDASHDARPPLRATAAFTLGVVGGNRAEARLETLVADGYPDVRFNAATGLARHGNGVAVDPLLEMLDPEASAAIDVEKQGPARTAKRITVLVNGLRATEKLLAANESGDHRPLTEAEFGRLARAVGQLAKADVPDGIRREAAEVARRLSSRGPPESAHPEP